MQIEYLQCVPGSDDISEGTIFVWFPSEMSSKDQRRAYQVCQTIKGLSQRIRSIDEFCLTKLGFWADIPADKWHAVLATLSFNGGTEIFSTED